MMNRDPLGIGKRITQLEKGYFRVLGHQLPKKLDMGRQLSAAPWTPNRNGPVGTACQISA